MTKELAVTYDAERGSVSRRLNRAWGKHSAELISARDEILEQMRTDIGPTESEEN